MGGAIGDIAGQGMGFIGQGVGAVGSQFGDFMNKSGLQNTMSSFFGTSAQFNPEGQISQKGTGLLGWVQENPALASGLTAAGLGAATGLDPYQSLSLGGQSAGGVQRGILAQQRADAENKALITQAQLEQNKLLLDINKAQKEQEQFNRTQKLEEQKAQQELINAAYQDAQKAFPKDPRAQAEYAQALISQRAKGGTINVKPAGWLSPAKIAYTGSSGSIMSANGR